MYSIFITVGITLLIVLLVAVSIGLGIVWSRIILQLKNRGRLARQRCIYE